MQHLHQTALRYRLAGLILLIDVPLGLAFSAYLAWVAAETTNVDVEARVLLGVVPSFFAANALLLIGVLRLLGQPWPSWRTLLVLTVFSFFSAYPLLFISVNLFSTAIPYRAISETLRAYLCISFAWLLSLGCTLGLLRFAAPHTLRSSG
ncbi:MAG: hypothetical protein MUD01_15430 [Chloroflexaceae bacterium]|jgi:hypothetical protein|nr:hypothetical protein [Chloroflexaceae bacterium]